MHFPATMTSVRTRENTFKVLLSTFPKRPSFEELHLFVYQTLGLRLDQVLRLQMNHAQNCVHVKCIDLKTAQDTVIHHDERHELEVNKKKYKVRLQMDDGGVEIKVHDLSENVTKDEMIAALKQFGDVLSTKEQSWSENFVGKGTASGVWVVKMNLRRHIRSFITIQGEQTLVTYRNQPQTCRHCQNQSHPGSTCVENKKLLGQKADLESRLKRAQASNGPGPSTQGVNTGSSLATFAAVLNNEAPLAPTPPFPRFFSTNETFTIGNTLERPSQQSVSSVSSDALMAPSTSITIIPTTTSSAVETTEHDHEMDQNVMGKTNTNETTVDQQKETITGEQSTQQLPNAEGTSNVQQNVEKTASSGNVSTFKTPAIPSQSQAPLNQPQAASPSIISLSMEFSESESNDSASENNPYQTMKRGRGRPKKQRINSPLLQTNPTTNSKI